MVDELWPGGPRLKEKAGVYKVGTDSILLAHFVSSSSLKRKKRAVDIGSGSGIISILLCVTNTGLIVDGIEIQHDAVQCATENAALSGLSDRINIIEGDLRNHRKLFKPGTFDFAVANPPFYPQCSGPRSKDASRAAARSEALCSLEDMCYAASFLVRWGGAFLLVHKPERLADVFRALDKSGLEPKRIRFVHHKNSSSPSLVLVESRRGGKPSLKIEAPLVLKNDDGSYSDEYRAIYHLS